MWRDQQRYVVARLHIACVENDFDEGVQRGHTELRKVFSRVKAQSIYSRRKLRAAGKQVEYAAIIVSNTGAHQETSLLVLLLKLNSDAASGQSSRKIQNVCGDRAHCASHFCKRNAVIWRCCSAASRISVISSLPSRLCSIASNSCADLPAAQTT